MVASQSTAVPQWLTGCTYDADSGNDLRLCGPSAMYYNQGSAAGTSVGTLAGVLGGGNSLKVAPGSGMAVVVRSGSFVVPASIPTAGAYVATLPSQVSLTVEGADSVNPRIDLVVAGVTDNGDSTSSGSVQVVTGVTAVTPVIPATPANSIRLGWILVPAGTTSVNFTNLTDLRSYTAASGGIIPMPAANAPAGYEGAYGHDPSASRLYHNSATGPVQAKVLPWAPVTATWNDGTPFHPVGNTTATASVTFTTDGQTNVKVTVHVPGIAQTDPVTSQAQVVTHLDGSQIDYTLQFLRSDDPNGIGGHGFTSVYTTGAETSDTPSAGSHTIAVYSWVTTGGAGHKGTGKLRVEPVTL